MDKENIIQGFIQNFISKNKKERTRIELSDPRKRGKFINRLNHDWEYIFDMRKLNPLPKVPNDYEYLKNELRIKDHDMCYVISHYDDIDDQFLEFKEAFDKSYCRGLGTLIIDLSVNRIYLETEEIGHKFKFFGGI